MVDGISFDSTAGTYIPDVELVLERAAIAPFNRALQRQYQTVRNAHIVAGIKQKLAVPYKKQLPHLTKQIADLETRILKSAGQERERLIKEREQLEEKLASLTEQIKGVGKSDKRVKRINDENAGLNMANHYTSLWLAQTAPRYNGTLRDIIGQQDQAVDVSLGDDSQSSSRSVFVAPTGFTGFLFGGGSNN